VVISKLDEENKVRFENIQSDCRDANEHDKILKSNTHTTERDKALYFEDADFC
jgi:hypothetical protein